MYLTFTYILILSHDLGISLMMHRQKSMGVEGGEKGFYLPNSSYLNMISNNFWKYQHAEQALILSGITLSPLGLLIYISELSFCLFLSLILISLLLPSMVYLVSKGVVSIHSVTQRNSPVYLNKNRTYPINYSIIIFGCLRHHTIIHWNLYTAPQGSTLTSYTYIFRGKKVYFSKIYQVIFFI